MHRAFALGAPEYRLERQQWVPGDLADVFAFFEDPHNLPKITPPEMRFRIVSMQPGTMAEGCRIRYRLRIHGAPCGWITLIERWAPNVEFVDTQLSGPYILWRHTHRFERAGAGVLLTDSVRYRVPFGPLGSLLHRLVIRQTVERIFDYREERVATLMSGGRVMRGPNGSAATEAA